MASSTFTDLCEGVEVNEANEVVNHPIFRELATGELTMERFQRFIQQDLLWMRKYHPNYTIMADKEPDMDRKYLLTRDSIPGSTIGILESYFKQFDFTEATREETYTQDFTDLMRKTALYNSIGECLAVYYPSIILWQKAGLEMLKVVAYENNIYSRLVQKMTKDQTEGLKQFQTFINGYYARATKTQQDGMLKYYAMGVQMEKDFCNGVYYAA